MVISARPFHLWSEISALRLCCTKRLIFEIVATARDQSVFPSIAALAEDVGKFTTEASGCSRRRSNDFTIIAANKGSSSVTRNFTLRYNTDIPSQVGLAGSSAIITACMRALMAFYEVNIPKPILANLILSVEVEGTGYSRRFAGPRNSGARRVGLHGFRQEGDGTSGLR